MRNSARPLKLAALGLLLLGAAPQDEAPLAKEIAELARRYAQVVAWEGVYEASESGAVTWKSAGGLNWGSASVNRSSHGRFRMERRSWGWEPERGMFSWAAGNKQVSGEVGGATDEKDAAWDNRGRGHEWHDQGSGRTPLIASEFTIWLTAGSAWIRPGDPSEPMRIVRAGRSVTEENLEAGLTRQKTASLDRVFDSPRFLPPLDSKVVNDKTHFRVAARGPGVLVFPCEGTSRADTQKSTMEITHRGRVTLFPIYDDLEVKVTIKDYEKWMPSGSLSDPSRPEAHLTADAVLVQKTKGPPPKAKRFRFELVEVSREPGVCMNWPRFGADGDAPPAEDPKPDLRFGPGGGAILTKEDLAAELPPVKNREGLESAAARVDCYDFGATADLRVTCDLEDGREIVGILRAGGSGYLSIPLPYRKPGSRIANAWKELPNARGGDGEDADGDPEGDGTRGDGFSNFEEYRGFVMDRSHLRTKPGLKDFFVGNLIGERALDGLGRLKRITGLDVRHELRADEMPGSRHMNVNRSAKSPRRSEEFQCGVILGLIAGGIGSMADIQGDVWRPKHTDVVTILDCLLAPGEEEELATTIAHELLHSIGVRHHGESDLGNVEWARMERTENGVVESWFEERPLEFGDGGWRYAGEARTIRIRRADGAELRAADSPGAFVPPRLMYVGSPWGQHSGVMECVMRYDCAQASIPFPGYARDRRLHPKETPGKELCTTPTGTDFNAPSPGPSRYGNAVVGNCRRKFCVRDDAPSSTKP